MENINKSNIEALLAEELGKLKRAVDYIEKAEKAASDATAVLSEIRNDSNALRQEVEELVDSKTEVLKAHFFEQRRANREFSIEQIESIKSRVETTLNEQKALNNKLVSFDSELRQLKNKLEEATKNSNQGIQSLQSSIKILTRLVIIALVFAIGLLIVVLYS